MVRFQTDKTQHKSHRLSLSITLFLGIFVLFTAGIDAFSAGTQKRQRETLERALNRSITYCYATEGVYPESLEVLKQRYGLTYDENQFYVDYKIVGANIYPDVTILEKGEY